MYIHLSFVDCGSNGSVYSKAFAVLFWSALFIRPENPACNLGGIPHHSSVIKALTILIVLGFMNGPLGEEPQLPPEMY